MKKTINTKIHELFSLKKKKILIVGGAGYLGKAITITLLELGANVIVASRNLKKGTKVVNDINKRFSNKAVFIPVDITNDNSLKKLNTNVNKRFKGTLDVLINCGWSGKKNSFDSISFEDWNYDIEVCLNAVFKTIKVFLPMLKKNKTGNILNIGSTYGSVAPDYKLYDSTKYTNPPSYGAAKAGIIQLTKYCASFFAKYKIRSNCLTPGAFPQIQTQKDNPKFIKRLAEKCPSNRIGEPVDLKGAVALLCTDAGSFINGQNLLVDGGWSIW